jgi:hypothetical protein
MRQEKIGINTTVSSSSGKLYGMQKLHFIDFDITEHNDERRISLFRSKVFMKIFFYDYTSGGCAGKHTTIPLLSENVGGM